MYTGNLVRTLAPSFLIGSFFILAGKEHSHKISDEFEFRLDSTTDCGISCPLASGKNPHRLTMGAFSTLVPSFFIGSSFLQVLNENMHKSLDEFDRPLTRELPAIERLKNQCIVL